MDFSLTPEQYAEIARYIVVVVIVGLAIGWLGGRAARIDFPEEQDDQRSQRGRY